MCGRMDFILVAIEHMFWMSLRASANVILEDNVL